MKSILSAAAVAALLATAPLAAFAQSSSDGLTRAQVRADLVQVEQAGYRPEMNDIHYPADIQAAEQRAHGSQTQTAAVAAPSAYKPLADETGPGSVYFGH
jgi:hypothetical protein